MLAAGQQLGAQGLVGPGDGPLGQHRIEQTLQFLAASQAAQGAGLVALAQRQQALVLLGQAVAGAQHRAGVLLVQRLQHRLEQRLALHQLVQALGQAGAVERLGQVGVRLVLQGTEDHGLAALGGDHDENALVADQPRGDQLLEHLLAVLAGAQVVVMEDDVVALLPAHGDGFLATVGGIHVARAHLAQHGLDRAEEVIEVVDHQKALVAVILHRAILGRGDGLASSVRQEAHRRRPADYRADTGRCSSSNRLRRKRAK